MLVVFGGLPGTGKTTVSRLLARRIGAFHLRIDAIEQALRTATGLGRDVGPAGYDIAMALARDNLSAGHRIVADCVNPIEPTRAAWRQVAADARCPLLEVELVCSDAAEHRRRVEHRRADRSGLAVPDWQAVLAREWAPWRPDLRLDTARLAPEEAVEAIRAAQGLASAP